MNVLLPDPVIPIMAMRMSEELHAYQQLQRPSLNDTYSSFAICSMPDEV